MQFTVDELFMELFKKGLITQVKACEVAEVDDAKDVCIVTPTDDGPEIQNVRLTATVADKQSKIVIYPKVSSIVLVGRINNIKTQNFVCAVSEIDRVKVVIENTSFTIDSDGIGMNDGSFGGMVKKASVISIVQFLQAMKNAFNSWTPVAGDGGAALKAAITSAIGSLSLPTNSDIENTRVKHG